MNSKPLFYIKNERKVIKIKNVRTEKIKLISMNKIHYLERWCDCEGYEQITPNVKYILNCVGENNNKIQLSLWEENGSCYSGYCNASSGNIDFNYVGKFGSFTHSPKHNIEFVLDLSYDNDNCKWIPRYKDSNDWEEVIDVKDVFKVSYDGGDKYYSCGYISVNEDIFTANNRYVGKPFVYIFKGDSVCGKSYLADKLDYITYETDSSSSLPDEILAEIIVIGNKYNYSIEDVRSRIPFDVKLINVDFKSK